MRPDRLLKNAAGSAPLESIFAIVFLMLLVLGVVQVSLTLYARNVIAASAHEGARAAVERGRTPAEASSIARAVVLDAAGGLIDDLEVSPSFSSTGGSQTVWITVSGKLHPMGVVPFPITFTSTASASRPIEASR